MEFIALTGGDGRHRLDEGTCRRVRELFLEVAERVPRGEPLDLVLAVSAARLAAKRLREEGGPDLGLAVVLAVTEDLWAAGR